MRLICANTPRVACKGALQDLYKDPQKGAPDIALKGALKTV